MLSGALNGQLRAVTITVWLLCDHSTPSSNVPTRVLQVLRLLITTSIWASMGDFQRGPDDNYSLVCMPL